MERVEPRKFELDLGDGKSPLTLWYPVGALAALSKKIGVQTRLNELSKIVEQLGVENLSAYVWAGVLWENRDARLETVAERVEASPRAFAELSDVVISALLCGLTGKVPGELEGAK